MSETSRSVVEDLLEAFAQTTESAQGPLARSSLMRGLRRFVGGDYPADQLLEACIDTLDAELSKQLDAILHHASFQALESAWRGLFLVVSRMPANENCKTELLNCSKEDLWLDFEDAPEVTKSGLYKQVYSAEFGPFGGRPFAAMIANYQFGCDANDLPLLQKCAQTMAYAQGVLIAAADPALLGRSDAAALADQGPAEPTGLLRTWQAFRANPNARYVGLTVLRVIGRAPHALASDNLRYTECIDAPEEQLWQNAGFALATCLLRGFAQFRLAVHLTGPVSGAIEELPSWSGPGASWSAQSPLEAVLTHARAAEIRELGFIPLVPGAQSGTIVCPSAPSCLSALSPRAAGLSDEDWELHRELPATLLVTRLAMHMKVLHREQIGTWREPHELRTELLRWFRELGSGVPSAEQGRLQSRMQKVLRSVELSVELPAETPWYFTFDLRLVPNWSVDGRFATFTISGHFDRE